MNILVLGGTVFVGRHIVEAAIERGHKVTLFNRGRTNQELFPQAEKLVGDRDSDVESLKNRDWDVVIDATGYTPDAVERTAKLLQQQVKQYVFISTISVYENFRKKHVEEDAPLAKLKEDRAEVNSETYGPLKAKAEEKVKEYFKTNHLIIRPGIVVGPDDPTDRFTYWVMRFQRGGQVLIPGERSRPLQWIDVRDLAEWTVRMTESKENGTYNAAGFEQELTMEKFVETLKELNPNAQENWIQDEFLLEHNVQPFKDLPLWLPKSEDYPYGFILVENKRAREKGLTFRSVENTVEATREWFESQSERTMVKVGLEPGKEADLIQRFSNHS
ncbi:isoflavone reductase [Pontibacillus halophilus JSM 076056 = DSM 19796]|uniref:Isoflavone reductase n=1 Tax=Pontibacillus halophilus JSM 076056 = DSM 19796 TaxID=1385510 RepID=A0A0A5GEY6_9BACI|nr:NAD-dependent epimerase/dehydratase family protein [Pontibacillus halophilus]KGX90524.1 isoflavone reductase [Pontibacillus halophilus JSM 076056 = DSM 19796]